MKLIFFSRNEIKKHIIIWSLLIITFKFLAPIPGGIIVNIVGSSITYTCYVLTYYILVIKVFPQIYYKRYIKFNLWLILVCIAYILIRHIKTTYIIPYLGGKTYLNSEPYIYNLLDALFQLCIISSCSFAFYLNKLNELKYKQQQQKEKELINQKLIYLKEQFNSHFTFNFLNFCYGRLEKHSEKATESIESYSELLEYYLKPNINPTTALTDEITRLKNYIALKQALSNKTHINLTYQLFAKEKHLLSNLFIDLVDEAILHSQIYNQNRPLLIHIVSMKEKLEIKITGKPSMMYLHKNYEKKKNDTIRILDIFHANKFKLKVEKTKEQYLCHLILTW